MCITVGGITEDTEEPAPVPPVIPPHPSLLLPSPSEGRGDGGEGAFCALMQTQKPQRRHHLARPTTPC